MKFKAVLFDLDGTLLDTLDDLANSMNTVLERAGYPRHDREAYKYFVGDGIRNLVRRALPEKARIDSVIDMYLAEMRDEYARRWDETTRPYDGIPELLDSLASKGVRMSILSNKAHEFTKLIADKLLAAWSFEAVLGESAETPKKPDPAGAIKIAGMLGIPAEEFLYLGDTDVDMKTANSAGMYAVGALWGFREAGELAEGGARVLIPKPQSLLDLL